MVRTPGDAAPSASERAGGEDLSAWLERSYARAFRTAYLVVRNHSDAEEAVQEAFLRVWRFRDALPANQGREAWLYRVLVNTCNSYLRREIPRRERRAEADALERVPAADSPEASVAQGEAEAVIAAAIDALPDHLRIPVILRYWTDLSEREIADAIKRRPGTVKSRLHEARRRLADDPAVAGLEVHG